jgi:hypothetical protein
MLEDILLCGLRLKDDIEGEGSQLGPALGLVHLRDTVFTVFVK